MVRLRLVDEHDVHAADAVLNTDTQTMSVFCSTTLSEALVPLQSNVEVLSCASEMCRHANRQKPINAALALGKESHTIVNGGGNRRSSKPT